MKHICNKTGKDIEIRSIGGHPVLKIGDTSVIIDYCPFCGAHLDNLCFINPMEYVSESKTQLLACGSYFGLAYYVVSKGPYPVAYVDIEKHLPDGLYVPRGGITWDDNFMPGLEGAPRGQGHRYLGWDYYTDASHEWTTQKIINEAKQLIGGLYCDN